MSKEIVVIATLSIATACVLAAAMYGYSQTLTYFYVQYAVLGLGIGVAFFYLVNSRERIRKAESSALQKQQIQKLTYERQILESNLRSLQAQIEPHFLFNTLSTILSLIDKDPAKGKTMLQSFTRYLRATLDHTRADCATLEDELKIISSYLEIFKVRMGDRLSYCIDVPAELQYIRFPPMLLQPLVENAVQHGLEPAIEGGSVCVTAHTVANDLRFILRIIVADTGLGINEDCGDGVGLTNIQKRLQILYGGSASLSLEPNSPRGLRAVIEVPYEKN